MENLSYLRYTISKNVAFHKELKTRLGEAATLFGTYTRRVCFNKNPTLKVCRAWLTQVNDVRKDSRLQWLGHGQWVRSDRFPKTILYGNVPQTLASGPYLARGRFTADPRDPR